MDVPIVITGDFAGFVGNFGGAANWGTVKTIGIARPSGWPIQKPTSLKHIHIIYRVYTEFNLEPTLGWFYINIRSNRLIRQSLSCKLTGILSIICLVNHKLNTIRGGFTLVHYFPITTYYNEENRGLTLPSLSEGIYYLSRMKHPVVDDAIAPLSYHLVWFCGFVLGDMSKPFSSIYINPVG